MVATAQRPTANLLDPKVLASLANLELVAKAVVEGFVIGLHRSPKFGFSQEFVEYRAYGEGDDPRYIDWNVYARTDKTYIKRFLGETNSHLMIMLDSSASMGFGSNGVSKLQFGKYLGASIRATMNLVLAAKARALMEGRYHVTAEDLKKLALPILRHRVLPNYYAESDGITVDQILTTMLESVAVPSSDEV